MSDMSTPTLYQRVLGRDFAMLPPVLQQFHSLPEGGRATGVIDIERGAGLLRSLTAGVLRLPSPGTKVPLRLQVVPDGNKETWIRHFGGQCLKTIQWQEGSYLVEKAGPLCLAFRLVADENGLTFYPRFNRVQGLQIPTRSSLRVTANARGVGSRWHIEVIIGTPSLGTITTYRGEVTPQSC